MSERTIPSPFPNPETQAFWDACKAGEFKVPRCRDCGKHHWYPRALCPYCFSDQIELVKAKGTGTIYSFSTTLKPTAYTIAYVELAEGPRMMTNILTDAPEKLKIGQPVTLTLTPSQDGTPVPMFKA
jgi:uncharacterized OB-fold protein